MLPVVGHVYSALLPVTGLRKMITHTCFFLFFQMGKCTPSITSSPHAHPCRESQQVILDVFYAHFTPNIFLRHRVDTHRGCKTKDMPIVVRYEPRRAMGKEMHMESMQRVSGMWFVPLCHVPPQSILSAQLEVMGSALIHPHYRRHDHHHYHHRTHSNCEWLFQRKCRRGEP